jgi:hypothetical protein
MLPPCLYAQKLKHKLHCPFLAFTGILVAFSRAIEMAYISVLTTPMQLYTHVATADTAFQLTWPSLLAKKSRQAHKRQTFSV